KNIKEIINSLQSIKYSDKNFEVIFIDDSSTDNTYSIIENEIKGLNNFSLLTSSNKTLPAKKGALQLGIEKAKHPFIMITDADCNIKPDWLKIFSQKFSIGYDFVFGIAPLINKGSFTGELSSFENLKSSMLSFSSAALNLPYSATARNFGFNKKSFNLISGYKNTKETLGGDDDLLLREAIKYKMKIGWVTNKEAFVFSKTKEIFKDYLWQKSRHTETALYYTTGRKIVLAVWHLTNIVSLASVLMVFKNWIFALPFFAKFFMDILLTRSIQNKFGYRFSFIKIIIFQIVYEIMLGINFFNALFGKKVWK
ncbi:MAG: glycosyltransferase, partial [Ignavibacteriaceae bacterium]|nr:glycosyltransferase [Ignavibacteriaceae bacterium]